MNDKFLEFARTIEPEFKIIPEQENFYANLINYFKQEPCEWDLNKGILINGAVGSGKTLAMRIMQASRQKGREFGIAVCRHIVREYMINGVTVIDKYGRNDQVPFYDEEMQNRRTKHYARCFDDFGAEETNQRLFGNQQNVMLEIILDRYELFKSGGMITHATTNLTPELLETQYGNRLRDRLREMMNYITLTGKSFRK